MLGHYEVIKRLAVGGMGEIYEARDTRLGRRVALKVLPSERVAGAENLKRFRVEARAAAAMNHPNIVTIHGVESDGDVHFIVMELVDGETLRQRIPAHGIALKEFFRIADQLTDAVAVAHASGITHRDLKPDNVMVTASGQVKVLDFGLAKPLDELRDQFLKTESSLSPEDRQPSARLTQDGNLVGTVPYMSPEHVVGKGVDNRSDIFALGIIFYEMLAGERPFKGESLGALLQSIRKDVVEPVTSHRPDVPQSLALAIDKCLEKDPAVRTQGAADLREQLQAGRREITQDPSSAEQPAQSFVTAAPAPGSSTITRAITGVARHRVPLILLGIVFLVNYVETAVEDTVREEYGVGVELGMSLARAAHTFEGPTNFTASGAANMLVVYGYSYAYFFALLALLAGTGWALARAPANEPFRVFALAIAVNYLISLPFFLFFPVPERWAFPDSGAVLLSDFWAPGLIDVFRPISGIDNCFPSFHVSLTVIMIGLAFLYRLRFRWVSLWVGLLIILSTSVLGIHWLTDIAAGLATGVLALQIARPRVTPAAT